MGLFDSLLNAMRLNPDEDDYDEYDDDFLDDEVDTVDEDFSEGSREEKPRRSFFRSRKEKEVDDIEDEPFEEEAPPIRISRTPSTSKVLPMRQAKKQVKEAMEVCIIKPVSVEDAREITLTLLNGRTVLLNMEGLNIDTAQRIIDFASGACYAIDGNLQKVTNYIFVLTPQNVDISGDISDLISSDSSIIQTNI